MNHPEVCAALLAAGGVEYRDPLHREARCFQFPRVDGPDCACNDKPPSVHVIVYPDFASGTDETAILGCVEFTLFGQFPEDGPWAYLRIYAVPREDAIRVLPDATRRLTAMWRAFATPLPAESPRTPSPRSVDPVTGEPVVWPGSEDDGRVDERGDFIRRNAKGAVKARGPW